MDSNKLTEAFSLFDKNKDGLISADELGKVLKSLGQSANKDQLKDMIREFDKNGDGYIDYEEFIVMMSLKTQFEDPVEDLRQAFGVFDENKDGFISQTELKRAMSNLGETLTDRDISKMMKEADTDGDGRINFEEFKRMNQLI